MIIIENYDNSKKELAVLLAESSNGGSVGKVIKFFTDIIRKIIDLAVKALTWITGQLAKGFAVIKNKIKQIAKKYNFQKTRTVTLNKPYKYKSKHIPTLNEFKDLKITKLSIDSNLDQSEKAFEEVQNFRIANHDDEMQEVTLEYKFKDSYDFVENGDVFIRDSKKQLDAIITHLKGLERELVKQGKNDEQDPKVYAEYRVVIQSIKTLTNAKVKFLDLVKTAMVDHLTATLKAKDEEIEKSENKKK